MHDLMVVFGAIAGWEFCKWVLNEFRKRSEVKAKTKEDA
jgi:hypothetical protein